MSESEGLWGLFYLNEEGHSDASDLVFQNRYTAEEHAQTLMNIAGIVSVEIRRLCLVKR